MCIKIENMLKSTLNPSSDINDTCDNHLQAGMIRTSTARIDGMKRDVDEIYASTTTIILILNAS